MPIPRHLKPETVHDTSAQRRQQAHVDTVFIRHHGILIGMQDLKIVKPTGQRRHQRRLPAREHQRPA